MHKIKEKLESALALFNISSDIKTNNEKRAEIKKILQEIREIYEIFPVGGILERNQVICEEKVFYEQKFMESLQYVSPKKMSFISFYLMIID